MPAGAMLARRPLKQAAASGGLPSTPSGTAVLWVKADLGAYQDTARTNPATTSGQSVQSWADQTGLGHHLTQATNPPTYQTNQINTLPCLRFNGTSQYLQALFSISQPFDIFLMMKQIAWTSGRNVLCGGTGDTFSLYQSSVTPSLTIYTGVGDIANNTNLALSTWGLVEAAGSGSSSYTKVNNTTAVSGTALTAADRGGITLAAHPGPSGYGNIDVAELIVYNAVLNGTDATAVRGYFTTRYGIP